MSRKVLIIGPAHPLRGGLATFNQRLAKQFIEEGDNCEIVSFSLQYPSFFFQEQLNTLQTQLPKVLPFIP